MRLRGSLVLLSILGLVVTACGKKGPPLAPLRLVPDAPAEFAAVRLGPDVHLRFTVPAKNVGGQGTLDLDRLEVYAVSVAPGAPTPPNRELLSATYLVGTVNVRPEVDPGEPAEPGPPAQPAQPDTRPGPGDVAIFVEPLTAEKMNPPAPPPPAVPAPTPAAVVPAAPAVPPPPAYPIRVYAVRGITRGGRPGPPAARVAVPLVASPAAPAAVTASYTEAAMTLSWTPPIAEVGGPPLLFNVFKAEVPARPLNPAPIATAAYESPGVEFGTEQCYSVRTVMQVGGISVQSEPSAPACVTPNDTFAPRAPAGLSGVATPGAVALIWDPNTEADLAGYLVLRGEAPGETLQPLTPVPITETVFRDTTVTPGVRYVYVVVAVDKGTPPNTSPHSARYEVTAAQ